MGGQGRQLYSLDSLLMYLLTLVGEAPVILIRFFATACTLGLLAIIKGHPDSGLWGYLPFLPTAWSAIALTNSAGTGWWWKQRMGGREASTREQLAYEDAIELLQGYTDGPLPLPHDWFVIDTPQPDAAVCGETLMLSRGLLETDHLPAVLAHELSPHSLRRTFASLLYLRGESPVFVMHQMGHTDPKLALRIYARVVTRQRHLGPGAHLIEVLNGPKWEQKAPAAPSTLHSAA